MNASKPYNPSIGTPNRRCVSVVDADSKRDLPKTYAEAAALYDWADKRRGNARGMIAHNTRIDAIDIDAAFAIVLYRTAIVRFYRDGSIRLHTGGYQTPTTRDRMNRCGIRISTGEGVPQVSHAGTHWPYVDGMTLQPNGVDYPPHRVPIGNVAEIRAKRRALLRKFKREEAAILARRAARRPSDSPPNPADPYPAIPFYWPTRQGGYTPHAGTVPEAFT